MASSDIANLSALVPFIEIVPGPNFLMQILLFIGFVLHLLFVNAVLGTSVILLCNHIVGYLQRERNLYAELPDGVYVVYTDYPEISTTLPKALSLTVNFGIVPMLFIQVCFGAYIYTSAVLSGLWWQSVMLTVMLAYYGLYLYAAWERLAYALRILALGLSVLLLLVTMGIFVNTVTLMQNPAAWQDYAVKAGGILFGFDNPQYLPRILHIFLACLAVGGLVLHRVGYKSENKAYHKFGQQGLRWFFAVTLMQIPVGFWFLFSLPVEVRGAFLGGNAFATILFAAAIFAVGVAIYAVYRKCLRLCIGATVITIMLMALMRSLLRQVFLSGYSEPLSGAVDVGPLLFFGVSLFFFIFAMFQLRRLFIKNIGEDA